MTVVRLLSLIVAGGSAVCAAGPMPVPRPQLFDEEFVKAFVGSYGFLSPVEPEVDPEEKELLAELAELFEAGRYRDVEAKLVNFIKQRKLPLDPEARPKEVSPAMVFVLGNLYFQNDRIADAERAYKLAIEKFPKFRRACKNLALLYATQNDPEQALPPLKQAIQLGDADHRSFGLLGWAYLHKEKPLAAEGAYRQAYLLNPDEKDWKMGLAQSLLLQEKWKESAALLGELIRENPDNPQLWKYQANCFIEMDRKFRAAANYEALRIKGLADAETLESLGNLYMDRQQPMLALGAYLAALERRETLNVQSALNTAKILVEFGAPGKAGRFLSAVREKGGESLAREDRIQILLIEIDAARARKERERVGVLLERLLEMDPGNGEALVRQGQHLEEMADTADDPETRSGLMARAKRSFRMALEKPDVQYDANLHYGQLLVRQRKFAEGLPHLKNALQHKESDNLKQYVRQVERAAKHQKEREEREEQARAEAAAMEKQKKTSRK